MHCLFGPSVGNYRKERQQCLQRCYRQRFCVPLHSPGRHLRQQRQRLRLHQRTVPRSIQHVLQWGQWILGVMHRSATCNPRGSSPPSTTAPNILHPHARDDRWTLQRLLQLSKLPHLAVVRRLRLSLRGLRHGLRITGTGKLGYNISWRGLRSHSYKPAVALFCVPSLGMLQ